MCSSDLVISGLGGPTMSGQTYALVGMTPALLTNVANKPAGQNNLNWLFNMATDQKGNYSAVGFAPGNQGYWGVC